MGQIGFFDLSNRFAGLDKFGDPLVLLKKTIPWEAFRPELKAHWRTPQEARKSNAGRKPWDEILMFKAMVLQQLYNLSEPALAEELVNLSTSSSALATMRNICSISDPLAQETVSFRGFLDSDVSNFGPYL